MINQRKVIGIIGGMGPMATADLFRKIIERTDAKCDSEHMHIVIDNNTDVPDRTACILSGSEAPKEFILESARRLQSIGADILIIPCNTSHYYYDKIAAGCDAPVLNMIEETAKAAVRLGVSCAGLLATDGTVQSGVYDKVFEKYGIKLIKPDAEGQKKLMYMTYEEIKAGKPANTAVLDGTLDAMEAQGCEVFILGCTELPLAFAGDTSRRFLDTTLILAEAAIRAVGGKVKAEV